MAQTSFFKAILRRREKKEQGDVRRRVTTREVIEKSRYIKIREEKEVREDEPIEYVLSTGVGSIFCVPERVLAVEVPQNEVIFGGEKE